MHYCHFLRHILYHRLANPSQGTAGDEDNARVVLRLVRGAGGVQCRVMYIHWLNKIYRYLYCHQRN